MSAVAEGHEWTNFPRALAIAGKARINVVSP
jgi:hypothetical protein